MNFIREGIIDCPGTVTMAAVRQLAQKISGVFPMECFQILLDHKKGRVHMLFDCYDRDNMKSYYLYEACYNKLSAIIINELGLNSVSASDGKWYRYLMVEDFSDDPKLFVKLKEMVCQTTTDDIARKLSNIFGFCEHVCCKSLKMEC